MKKLVIELISREELVVSVDDVIVLKILGNDISIDGGEDEEGGDLIPSNKFVRTIAYLNEVEYFLYEESTSNWIDKSLNIYYSVDSSSDSEEGDRSFSIYFSKSSILDEVIYDKKSDTKQYTVRDFLPKLIDEINRFSVTF